jgi:hypothetical protein
MPTKERSQKAKARRVGLSKDVQAFLAIVNDGKVTFPSAYVPKHGRHAVLMMPLAFDADGNDLHAEVRAAAAAIANELVFDNTLPHFLGNTNLLVLPKENLIHETQASLLDEVQVLQQGEVNGLTVSAREPENAVRLAASTALWTVRDAVEQLLTTGGHRCLVRCCDDACRRLLFADKSDTLTYCRDRPCRQRARRKRELSGR